MNGFRWTGISLLSAGLVMGTSGPSPRAQGNQPNGYSDRNPTGTTDASGAPQRQGGTITSNTGNTATANTPAGTDPAITPSNRNPYNDRNYRPGTPGTSVSGGSPTETNPRPSGNASTLGTAAPVDNSGTTPGLAPTNGQAPSTGAGIPGSPSGNPGPIGNAQTPSPAPTSGGFGAGGSGVSGTPGSISNAGTHGNSGSGH